MNVNQATQNEEFKLWGRAWNPSWATTLGCVSIFLFAPLTAFYFYICAFHFDCSLWLPIQKMWTGELSIISFFHLLPPFSWAAGGLFLIWVGIQAVLAVLPDVMHRIFKSYQGGKIEGAITPAGLSLIYRINGLQAWVISHILFFLGAFVFDLFSPTIIFDNWGSLLWIANITGFVVGIFVYIKALTFPSYAKDRKFSGNAVYDFIMGVELNPRIGPIDFKLFFNGRPGIVAWTLINISFASAQFSLYGTVTNSMVLVNVLQGLYVLYFFWKEAWYLKTIDIHHDHFGWMLAWGDAVWLPYMYTLQALYLVFNPIELSTPYFYFVLALGLIGFLIFASSNNQKDRFRRESTPSPIWGKTPQSITCSYVTQDGTVRQTRLLTSGWWGLARHMNYTGDLILSLAYSIACGTTNLFPYFYFFFLLILLVHRCLRDEDRCRNKYGEHWKTYCAQVPYRLIPGVW
jgi:7-dehydrocholesterol reductase